MLGYTTNNTMYQFRSMHYRQRKLLYLQWLCNISFGNYSRNNKSIRHDLLQSIFPECLMHLENEEKDKPTWSVKTACKTW